MDDTNASNIKPAESTEPFAPIEPKREWLLRCQEPEGHGGPAVCAVLAEAATVVIVDIEDRPVLVLDGSQIGEFRAAFQEATAVANSDIHEGRVALLAAKVA